MTAKLDHPGTARALDIGIDNELVFLVTEWISGLPLSEVLSDALEREEVYSPSALQRVFLRTGRGEGMGEWASIRPDDGCVKSILRQVAEALSHAHERGVAHRDIKPSNVIIGFDGRARIIDFGLATPTQPEHGKRDLSGTSITHVGRFMGSMPYAAPEQLEGFSKSQGNHTDVFGWAAMAVELYVGTPPFASVENRVLDTYVGPSPSVLAGVSNGLRPWVAAALEYGAYRRPTARQLASILTVERAERRETKNNV